MHRPYAQRLPASTGRRKIVVASTMRAPAAPPTMAAMTTTTHEVATSTVTEHDDYVLGRTQDEYARLRAQARVWAQATGRLLDQVELARSARCLDAGCGPGETMRQLAQRVGPAGEVVLYCTVDPEAIAAVKGGEVQIGRKRGGFPKKHVALARVR